MKRILIEACCGSVDDCVLAAGAGADRLELNSALFLGGLTPSLGMIEETISRHLPVQCMIMIRPRSGGFHYTDAEFRTMCRDAEAAIRLGADGLVFGPLTMDGMPDAERVRTLVSIAGERQTVFHRAIDVCPDWRRAMDSLITLGVTRILTSGQQQTALEGIQTLQDMQAFASGQIEILPAGGIRLENAARIIEETGCNQIHFAKHLFEADPSMQGRTSVTFNGRNAPEDGYAVCDAAYFEGMRKLLDGQPC
ncbi:MAG: copper homeostasis protein CutC [Clostridia bacterium]|nr:copper homeostasis protein CutC [Clostridia bacterium]